ncbi:2OG-Fe dioxygenase family protein [Streptomyces johnsoniae]|uniref:2OG-Fe dioxygenase family protein n=1 Tax=Streptomyces johnsoniae TaxID=3075532 RepID=A0ABU2RZI8_9ACTN|nr:2OG-Fe dioxygenase family protein [Streptomyces sp. DSM 41886]MDT0442057.1 2OG-Fe dioxygenase family protein [Streptomyces sp. DSM 41886]
MAGQGEPSLTADGFERFSLSEKFEPELIDTWYEGLKAEFADLPADPYGDPELRRYRRHSSAVLLPWERRLHWVPKIDHPEYGEVAHYFQGGYNPEHQDEDRYFPAIAARAENNPLLERIVLFDFAQTWWGRQERSLPLHVGVHFIKLAVADGEGAAVSSPNFLHQDGEPFHFAHLVYKQNAVGGTNYVADVQCAGAQPADISPELLVATFDLEQPLDSYGIHDERVSHHVDPIRRGDEPCPGERAVILVDITPLVKAV